MSTPHATPPSGAPEPGPASRAPSGVEPAAPAEAAAPPPEPGRRPILERLGLAAIALVLAALFAGVAVAAFAGGELFLAAMGAIGAFMTIWAGAITLVRG